jgi:hypothetical protein
MNYKNGEAVYITEKCLNYTMLTTKELWYVGLSKRGGHILETGKGSVITCVPGSWFRKAEKVPYFVNVFYNSAGTKINSSMYHTPEEAAKNTCIDGYRFVETITVFKME